MNTAVAIFTYKRVDHLKSVINSLKRNNDFETYHFFIYSDASRGVDDIKNVKNVRDYLLSLKSYSNFYIIERQYNLGLAKNLTQGITETLIHFQSVIVIEDDILVTDNFLSTMSTNLNNHYNNKKIWQINGFNFPIKSDKFTFYQSKYSYSWGWGTWRDRWNKFVFDPQYFINKWTFFDKYFFDVNANGIYWPQLLANYKGSLRTWAVLWQATIYDHKGFTLTPTISMVVNIGFDGTGENCSDISLTSNDTYVNINNNILTENAISSLIFEKKEKQILITILRPNLIRRYLLKIKLIFEYLIY